MSTATLTRPPSTYTSQKGRTVRHQPQTQYDDGNSLTLTRTRPGGKRGKRGRASAMVRKEPPPLIQKVGLAAQVYGIQSIMGTVTWLQSWREWLYPPGGGPNIVKAYEARPGLPVRIFFPASFDPLSPQELPTVLSIHGGGFCIGTAKDDDEWNRNFADSQNMLVVSLPYQKAPRAPFPLGLQDLEALYLAVLADESLPIDRTSRSSSMRTTSPSLSSASSSSSSSQGGRPPPQREPAHGRVALLGFDAGGNLALALGQLAGIRYSTTPPTAVISICGYLDLERPTSDKLANRPYKPALSRPRNHAAPNGGDPLTATHPAYVWSYVPYGHDLRDPLLSPAFAGWDGTTWSTYQEEKADRAVVTTNGGRGGLPPHVCLVGAELDMLAHESWRLACRLVRDGGIVRGDGRTGRWRVPDPDADADEERICGRSEPARTKGRLEVLEEELRTSTERPEDGLAASKRFGFEVRWRGSTNEEGSGSVKWMLVPDVMHGFDRGWWVPPGGGGKVWEETVRDAQLKTVAYVDAVGGWLRGTVWEM